MIKIRLKNRPYGFIYKNKLPEGTGYRETLIPAAAERTAVTGDYSDMADNHCAAICTMNTILLLRRHFQGDIGRCRIGNDRKKIFQEIHKIVPNGPVILYKPKLNRYLKTVGSKMRAVPVRSFAEIEKSISDKRPVPMMVNAGITHWHWILVIGIRKYHDGAVYLNILDGWNHTTDRYLRYTGRDTYIRALKII